MKGIIQQGILILLTLLLGACSQQVLSVRQRYQVNANAVLKAYANDVSRGINSKTFSRGRGMAGMDMSGGSMSGMDMSSGSGTYGNSLADQQSVEEEAKNCLEMLSQFPATCDNYPYIISSLARCLNRVLTKNPLLTYSFQNLDDQGQWYWAYLLNWRAPHQTLDTFSSSDFTSLLSLFKDDNSSGSSMSNMGGMPGM